MSSPAHDALDRLEADDFVPSIKHEIATVRERLDTLTAQVERLTRERDEERRATASFDAFMQDIAAVEQANARAEAAEAENARLTALLNDHEAVARMFHEAYEELAPNFGYRTRDESAVSWPDVPERNRALMIATVAAVSCALLAASSPAPGDTERPAMSTSTWGDPANDPPEPPGDIGCPTDGGGAK